MAIDSGHTAWILMSMALVQLMLPGLAFFYAGLLHRNSVVTMIMQNYASMGVVTIVWFLIGFSLCLGEDAGNFIPVYIFAAVVTGHVRAVACMVAMVAALVALPPTSICGTTVIDPFNLYSRGGSQRGRYRYRYC